MAYQVLARKWRPKTFADLVGQEHVVKALQNALANGRLHHAYLLTGTRGVGKTTIARILAKSLNCETPQHGEPCGHCPSCTAIDQGRFVDLLEIDAASNTGIDNIREVLENAQYAPTAGKYKVYIIDEVHMLSKSAFNAMLKTLEEPPAHVKFILATTDPHKVPVTVLSRCLQFVLRNMTAQQVADHLRHVLTSEHIAFEEAALMLLGRAAAGSMRDALSLLDQAIAMGSGSVREADVREMIGAVDKRYLYELLDALRLQNGEALLAKAAEMSANAVGFDSALNDLALLLQRLALLQTVPSAIAADDPDREMLAALAQHFGSEQIQLYYQCVIHGKQDLPLAPDEYAGFVMTLLRMLAFAPLAAADVPVQGKVEGSALHHPTPKPKLPENPVSAVVPPPVSAAPAKPDGFQAASEKAQTSAGAANTDRHLSADTALDHQINSAADVTNAASDNRVNPAADTPPWDTESASAAHTQVEPAKAWSTAETDVQAASVVEAQAVQTAAVEPNEPNKPLNTQILAEAEHQAFETVHSSEDLVRDAFQAAWADEPDFQPDYPMGSGAEAYDSLPEPIVPPARQAEPHNPVTNAEAEAAAVFVQTAASETAPMPPLAAENWQQIAARISRSVAGAQIVLQHLAWADFDAAQNRLVLALDEKQTSVTASSEFFERIQNALAQAYALPLTMQTTAWLPETHGETPLMFRNRRQTEAREHAKSLMQQDKAMQDILRCFEAVWDESSVRLLDEAA